MDVPWHANEPLRCGIGEHPGVTEDYHTPQYAFVCCTKGGGKLRYRSGAWMPFHAGQAFQRYPNTIHTIAWQPHSRSWHVALPAQVYTALCEFKLTTLQTPILSIPNYRQFQRRQRELSKELAQQYPHRMSATLTRLQQFLVDIHLYCLEHQASRPAWLDAAFNFLRSNDWTLAAIAKHFGISPATFQRRFTTATGLSPGAWRSQQRLELAKNLMANKSLSLQQIAQRCGFRDNTELSRSFKRGTGLNPNQFRKTFFQ